jgi:hypothetical protein
MMRTVVVSTLVSMLMAVATAALYMRLTIGDGLDVLRAEMKQADWECMSSASSALDGVGDANRIVSNLATSVSSVESGVSGLESDVSTLESKVSDLEFQVLRLKHQSW